MTTARRVGRVFAWRSAAVFATVGAVVYLLVGGIVDGHFERSLEFHAQFVVGALVEPELSAGPLDDETVRATSARLADEAEFDTQVLGVEAIGPTGLVVVSDDLTRTGSTATSIVPPGRHLTIVPVTGHPNVTEIRVVQDRQATDLASSQLRRRLALVLFGGLGMLWSVLLPVARRLGGQLEARTVEAESSRVELERLLSREQDTTARLVELNEMKSSFLTAISHELRTPLTVIRGVLTTLLRHRDKLDDDGRNALLDSAGRHADRLGELVSNLLELNSDDDDAQDRAFTPVDLAAAVVSARRQLPPHTLSVSLEVPEISADRDAVERALVSLIGNALRHAPGSPVQLRTVAVEGGVELTVSDEGPGVPDELKHAVFEPFRQGPLLDDHAPGTGIGLALVARAVARHGGCAWVTDAPGGGAAFHLRLPNDPAARGPTLALSAACANTHDHAQASHRAAPGE